MQHGKLRIVYVIFTLSLSQQTISQAQISANEVSLNKTDDVVLPAETPTEQLPLHEEVLVDPGTKEDVWTALEPIFKDISSRFDGKDIAINNYQLILAQALSDNIIELSRKELSLIINQEYIKQEPFDPYSLASQEIIIDGLVLQPNNLVLDFNKVLEQHLFDNNEERAEALQQFLDFQLKQIILINTFKNTVYNFNFAGTKNLSSIEAFKQLQSCVESFDSDKLTSYIFDDLKRVFYNLNSLLDPQDSDVKTSTQKKMQEYLNELKNIDDSKIAQMLTTEIVNILENPLFDKTGRHGNDISNQKAVFIYILQNKNFEKTIIPISGAVYKFTYNSKAFDNTVFFLKSMGKITASTTCLLKRFLTKLRLEYKLKAMIESIFRTSSNNQNIFKCWINNLTLDQKILPSNGIIGLRYVTDFNRILASIETDDLPEVLKSLKHIVSSYPQVLKKDHRYSNKANQNPSAARKNEEVFIQL